MKRLIYFWIIFSQVLLTACGDNSEFKVAGEIVGMGTQNLRIYYYANGAMRSVTTAALDGKFRFAGQSDKPVIVEIFSSNRTLIGRVFVKNGEELNCKFDKNSRYNVSISGNDVSSDWGKFLTENSKTLSGNSSADVNKTIADYVDKHRNNVLSSILLLTEYNVIDNELMTDSLMRLLSPEAAPDYLVDGFRSQIAALSSSAARGNILPMNLYCSDDSLYQYNPAQSEFSVIYFSTEEKKQRDSVVVAFRSWSKDFKNDKLKIVDISLTDDTLLWHENIKTDSAEWVQCWALGSVASKSIERLSIPRTPYFIVADSVGHQLYRGSSFNAVKKIVNDSIQK